MTETQKRIKAYKKALPHMKERVTAVAMLLVIAVTMMTSATFAWMTLSRSPEASSIFTTVTTNGNLEIALSGQDGQMPLESAIGDGSLSIVEKNRTWGNLINLSDISYGLKDIVLRPASLNTKTLATNPMYAVKYGPDGRVIDYLYDFLYANYVEDPDSGVMYFAPEEVIKYGVRAISTVTYEDIGTDAVLVRKIEEINARLIDARQSYQAIYDINNSSEAKQYMSAVGGLVGVHVDKTMNGGSPDASAYMEGLYNLSNAFLLSVVDMGNVIVEGANLCIFMSLEDRSEYDDLAFTFDDLVKGVLTNDEVEARCDNQYNVNFTCIEDFRNMWKKLAGYDNEMQGVNAEWKPTDENGAFVENVTIPAYNANYKNPTTNSKSIYGAYEVILAKYQNYRTRVLNGAADQTVPWDNWMIMAVNQMCDMDTATIKAGNNKEYTAAQLLQEKANKNIGALSPFAGSGPFYAKIYDGAIQDAGQLLGKAMEVPSNDQIRVKADIHIASLNYTFKVDMKPSITTAYDVNGNVLASDLEEAKRIASGGNSNYKGIPIAAETYAMVIDFWLRTNAQDTLLTLEGELLYNQRAGTNAAGQKVGLLFSYTETDPATQLEATHYVYLDQGKYYYDFEKEGINDELTAAQVAAIKNSLKIVYEEKPSGYEGVNRVWDEMNDPENQYVQNAIQHNGMNTTQGSGSCYIFYPQSLEDHQQSLKLLSAMRVAFVDANGTLLATAYMDTDNVVENAGRVIVPLRLQNNDTPIMDADGNMIYDYITPMMKNEAKRVSAIVYLEGEHLKNSEVLAAGSITGQMNIQFGTTDVKLNAVDNDEVMKEYYTFNFALDANRDGNIGSDEQDKEYELSATADRIIDLSLDLGDAASPKQVEGNFVAVINATQGARQNTFTMFQNEQTGLWEAYHYVKSDDPLAAGTYVKGIPFSGPGNYQLRSIRIDGVDYLLEDTQFVKIKIPGMAVSALQWDDTLENSKFRRTAEAQFEGKLRLRLESDDNKMHKVQGVFLGENGQNVTVTFYSDDKLNYEGIATFSAGGKYELTYVYIDDNLVALDEAMYKQIELQLGLQVEVGYTAPKVMESEMKLPDGWDSWTQEEKDQYVADIMQDMTATPKLCYFRYNRLAPLEMNVWCKVYDDQDKELTELENLQLYFGTGGNPLDADLTWNPDTERYEGTFLITRNGIYNFSSLILDDGSPITKAVSSPTIQSASPDPVYYVHHMNQYPTVIRDWGLPKEQRVLQFKLRNSQGAALKVALNNILPQAGIATVDETEEEPQYIIIDNLDEQYASWWAESQPDSNGVVTYTLKLPSDGYWEIAKLYLGGGAYYDGKVWSGETDADWADLSELVQADNIKTCYLTEVNLTATGLPSNTTVEFMQHKKGENDCNITIKVENQGRPLAEVLEEVAAAFPEAGIDPSVVIDLKYGYSKWSGQKWTTSNGTTLPMTLDGGKLENGVFTMNVKLTTEGEYTPNFTLKICGEPYTGTIPDRLNAARHVSVRWEQPTIVVDSVSPAAGQTFSTTQNSGGAWVEVAGVSNYISANKDYAAVYLSASKNSLSNWNYSAPSVTLQIDKDGEGAAKLTMVNAADKNTSHVFNFSASTGKATASIGRVASSSLGHDTKYLAGKTTFTAVTKTCDAGEFTLPLAKPVTIEQPEAPYMLSFGNVPMSIPENQRPTAVMANGSEVTVYLPKLTWTETWTEDPVYGEWSSWSAPKTIRTDYNTRSWSFIITYTRYNYFIWGEYSRTRSATGATMEQKKQIQKWIINGVEYEAGLTYTIQLDGNAIASAVITDVAPAYSVGSKTITETDYAYGYQASSTDQKNTPAGGKNISSDNEKPKLFSDGYMYEDINGYEEAWP